MPLYSPTAFGAAMLSVANSHSERSEESRRFFVVPRVGTPQNDTVERSPYPRRRGGQGSGEAAVKLGAAAGDGVHLELAGHIDNPLVAGLGQVQLGVDNLFPFPGLGQGIAERVDYLAAPDEPKVPL